MNLKVTIITPDRWYQSTKYRLEQGFTLSGVHVPAGLVSDGATLPRWISLIGIFMIFLAIWLGVLVLIAFVAMITLVPVLFPSVGRYTAAAFLHDYLLNSDKMRRKQADLKFKQGLKELGITSWCALTMYYAVRCYSMIKAIKTIKI